MFSFYFQSGVKKNGRVVQGYTPIIEAKDKQKEDEEDDEEEEEDKAMSVSLSLERNQTVNLGTGGKSPLSQSSQKTTGQSSRRSRRKIQEITLTTLDPSNLSPR